ncbi:MAG: chloride channel protein [Dehalococcoidia bacterium]|nr:chloride channel protein [Dehalococcoidia bacterium]
MSATGLGQGLSAPPPPRWRQLRRAVEFIISDAPPDKPGDFTTPRRVVPISFMAMIIGALSAVVALALLRLIGFFTNLFFFFRLGTKLLPPDNHVLGAGIILVPVIGGIIVGLMARYGSERIRGHGIPEALEVILINGSRMEPKVTLLKPVSSAISIGSGGPFGAEGPIIVTGGALGSMIAQFFHLTSIERRTLLVAGAAGGMSATFASPVAAVLLAVELLLFEFKPRSLIPVALSSATAELVRIYIIGKGPIFPTPPRPATVGTDAIAACILVGVLAGVLAIVLTVAVYAVEDGFHKLPVHWMWWPAIGGLVVGVGGVIYPKALGVGYSVIGDMLQGDNATKLILGVLLVKSVIWAVSLGSGTSGGVVAPLLMMGAALGAFESRFLPNEGPGFWPMISMAAVLGGTMRVPFTGVIFALELTHDVNALLPLLVAVVVAYGSTVLILRRSILTEKVARRGYNLGQEYALDPLEMLLVRDVMRTTTLALSPELSVREVAARIQQKATGQKQRLYPVVDAGGSLLGITSRDALQEMIQKSGSDGVGTTIESSIERDVSVAYPDEPLAQVAFRMAGTGHNRMPVLERGAERRVIGMVSLSDLLKARGRTLEEERVRERVIRLRWLLPGRRVETIAPPEEPIVVSEPPDRTKA